MSSGPTSFLAVHCKRAETVDLKEPIQKYVISLYGAQQANDASSDLDEVQNLRNDVLAINSGGPSDAARDTLTRYFRALSVMETRFPISKDRDHVQIDFTWMDSIQPRRKTRQRNIHFEKASVLFNLGAVLSQQAVSKDRGTSEGCKEACALFQEAAGVFIKVKDVALKMGTPRAVDLTSECLSLLEKLMLAQAQECVYLKANKDKKTPLLLARLTKQTSMMYAEALSAFTQQALKDHFDKGWTAHVQIKSWMYDAVCQHHAAQHAASNEDIATEISRLRHASALLHRLRKDSKAMSQDIQQGIKQTEDAVNARLARAEKDNASVYLVKILQFSELPPVEGALLVKSTSPGKLDASKEHLFSELVPEASAKALSRYSELVDDLIRQEMGKLESATDDARIKLKEWELPEMLDAIDSNQASALPEHLRRELEEVQKTGGVTYLKEIVEQIAALRQTAEEDLNKCEAELDEEAKKDADMRSQHGDKWKPPPSSTLNGHFRQMVGSYRDNLSAAGNSDKLVLEKLSTHEVTFANLTPEAAATQLPHLQAPMVNIGATDPVTIVANLRKSLEQLNSISAERAGLEDALKEKKTSDNILPKLMASTGSYDDLFHNEMKKYDELKVDVKDNLDKQAQLLTYIGSASAAFRETFNVADWRSECNTAAKDIKEKVHLFYEVRDNLGEGMRFYMSLQDAVRTLVQQTSDFCMTRRIQRDDHLQGIREQMFPPPSVHQLPQQVQSMNMNDSRPPQLHNRTQHEPPPQPQLQAQSQPQMYHPQQQVIPQYPPPQYIQQQPAHPPYTADWTPAQQAVAPQPPGGPQYYHQYPYYQQIQPGGYYAGQPGAPAPQMQYPPPPPPQQDTGHTLPGNPLHQHQ